MEKTVWEGDMIKKIGDRYIINKETGCWEWTGGMRPNGYGVVVLGIKYLPASIRAHRFSWMAFNGEIPDGLFVLHKCDNRKCINPNHLFLGTHKDNAEDRERKGRDNRPFGEAVYSAKITNDIAAYIKYDIQNKMSRSDVLKKYGIRIPMYQSFKQNRAWKKVKAKDSKDFISSKHTFKNGK